MKKGRLSRQKSGRRDGVPALVVVFGVILFFTSGALCFAGGKKQPLPPSETVAAAEETQAAAPVAAPAPAPTSAPAPAADDGSGAPAPAPVVRTPTVVDQLAKLIAEGKVEEAKTFFISGSVQPNDVDWDGRNAVHHAALAQNSELADFFIRLRANPDLPDNEKNTPLNISSNAVDTRTAAILAAAGARIHHRPDTGTTPAQIAVRPENAAFLKAILTADSLVSADENGKTILHIAIEAENLAAVEAVLAAARDSRGNTLAAMINKRDSSGRTALDLALSQHDSAAAAAASAAIIAAGGTSMDPFFQSFSYALRSMNYNMRSSDGISPLHYAVREHYRGWTDYLLSKRANPDIKNSTGATPLIVAAQAGDLDAMRKLIEHGAQVNAQDTQGNTAMHMAIPVEVHREAFEILLNNSANPNIRNSIHGDAPLHVVVALDRPVPVLEILLSRGADVAIFNFDGKTPLYSAVEKGRSALIPVLLQHGSDIFTATNQGVTPFEKALETNSSALNEMITDETVVRSDAGGNTPLIAAVRLRANPEIARRILDKNANVNARNQEGDTALHVAVRQNDAAIGELLISRGADIFLQNAKGESPISLTFYTRGGVRDWMFVPAVLSAKDPQGKTILHFAAEWKLDQIIPGIVSRGAAVDLQDGQGETPLFIAVRINSASTVRALMQAGASPFGRDVLGNTALHAAVRYNALSAAEALLAAKVDINAYNTDGNTALHDAVQLRNHQMANLLVQRGANLEARDAEGNTALMRSVQEVVRPDRVIPGDLRLTEHLVRAGADINTRNNDGKTPLFEAVLEDRGDLVALLLDNQAQIHARDFTGESPFIAALRVSPRMALSLISKGREQIDEEGRSLLDIALLAGKSGADIKVIADQVGPRYLNAVDREGRTPLRYAVDLGNWEAAKFLAEQGADVFAVARDGQTPADVVIATGNRDAVRALFDGKSISLTDRGGNTALHYAAKAGAKEIISFMLELGASKSAKNNAGETPADVAAGRGYSDAAAILR